MDAATPADGRRLPADWRTVLPARLEELAAVWREESAWQGQVSAGGIEMSAEQQALVCQEELVMHGWDVARASGQDFVVEEPSLVPVDAFFTLFGAPDRVGERPVRPGGGGAGRRLAPGPVARGDRS